MDSVVWIIGGIFIIGLVIGVYRGALRISVSIITAILTLIIAFFVTPYAAQIVEQKTPLDESVKRYVSKTMADVAQTLPVDMQTETIEESEGEITEHKEIPRDIQVKTIENADLPDVLKNVLAENNNYEIYNELGVETFVQYTGAYLAKIWIRVCMFVLLILLTTIILRAIVFALNIINEIPVFGLMNRLIGGVMGIAGALFIVWFLFIIVVLLYSTETGKMIYEAICENVYTRFIFDYNPLLNMSVKF